MPKDWVAREGRMTSHLGKGMARWERWAESWGDLVGLKGA